MYTVYIYIYNIRIYNVGFNHHGHRSTIAVMLGTAPNATGAGLQQIRLAHPMIHKGSAYHGQISWIQPLKMVI